MGRDHHVTFVAVTDGGNYLFAGGGTDYASNLPDIERATIQPDGMLGTFADAGLLPLAVVGAGVANLDERTALIVGGLVPSGNSAVRTFIASVADDGSLSFTEGPHLNSSRYHLTLNIHGGYAYAIGGLVQSGATQSLSPAIERAPITGTSIGAWEALTSLPNGTSHHAAAVHGDSLYLISGVEASGSQDVTLNTIQRAQFASDGTLGPFSAAGTLPDVRLTSSALVLGDQLFVIGGASSLSGGVVDTVLRAPFNADGSVGAFEQVAILPKARQHSHQSPWLNGFAYSVGGSDANMHVQPDVFIGALP